MIYMPVIITAMYVNALLHNIIVTVNDNNRSILYNINIDTCEY